MLNINTNLSSLIAQNSLNQSTNKLNTAIERMSTGCKINHAKDNAANYSISTNMTTKIGAYQVAEDNALQGLDMINTASESLTLIEDKLMRLRALAEQSANGTYGAQSKQAINQEANAIVDEIERLYNTTEYNGINLAKGKVIGTEESKFIKDIDRRDTSKMTTLASVAIDEALTSGTYSISTADELAKLATMTNNGLVGAGCEFVLGADIDLSGYSNWTPIGVFVSDVSGNVVLVAPFEGSFDGNGYEIINLNISSSESYQGLFGEVKEAVIYNLGVSGQVNVSGRYSGLLIGHADSASVENCYTTGDIVSTAKDSGGIIGISDRTSIKDSYFDGNISGDYFVGGITGTSRGSTIINCFTDGEIDGVTYVGGLVGDANSWPNYELESLISNSYSTMSFALIVGTSGGLIGRVRDNTIIRNSYSDVDSAYAGLVGTHEKGDLKIENSSVQGQSSSMRSVFVDLYEVADAPTIVIKNSTYNSYYDGKGLNYVPHVANSSLVAEVSVSDVEPFEIKNVSNVIQRQKNFSLQIGIDSKDSSQILINTEYLLDSLLSLRNIGSGAGDYLTQIDTMLAKLSEKQTHFGATSNRLESVLEEIGIQYDNLVSSRSTLRDADIAEVSAEYIQQQILQQASATLLATANQSPSIALQLL